MIRTEETKHTYKMTGSATYSYKTVTSQGDGKVAPEPAINNITIINNNIGNSSAKTANGDAVSTANYGGPSGQAGAKDAETPETRLTVKDLDSLGNIKITRKNPPNWRNIILLLAVGIAICSLATLAWKSDKFGTNGSDSADNIPQIKGKDYEASTTTEIITSASSATSLVQEIQTSTTAPKPLDLRQDLHIEINYLLDILSISNWTREVVIKSTNDTGAVNGTLVDLLLPRGPITMTVVNDWENGSLTHLREVLEWLSPSLVKLTIDASISKDQCGSGKPTIRPSFLQKDILSLPNLGVLEIRNLNYCFISLWIRHFRVPAIKHVRVFSMDDRDQPYHQDLTLIFNESHLEYTIEVCDDETLCKMY